MRALTFTGNVLQTWIAYGNRLIFSSELKRLVLSPGYLQLAARTVLRSHSWVPQIEQS